MRAGARIGVNGKGKGGYGHRLVASSYTVRTKLYRLLQSDVYPIQDVVGGMGVKSQGDVRGVPRSLDMRHSVFLI